jgi:hypothetical protein
MAQSLGGVTIKRDYRGHMLVLNASPRGHVELSGIHFTSDFAGADDNWTFTLVVNQLNGLAVLVHDCSFVTGYEYAVLYRGNGGVVWNCSVATYSDALGGITFVNTSETCGPWNHPDTTGASATKYGSGDPTGTLNTYVESCFFRDAWVAMSNFDDNSRVVWRYNRMDNAACASHGQETSIWGTRQWEVYGCKFTHTSSGKAFGGHPYPLNFNYWFEMRGGTGVFTNNEMDDIPWGKTGVQLNVFSINRKDSIPCQTAYPAARQIGQGWSASSNVPYGTPVIQKDGIGAVTDPVYIWSNTGAETSDPNYVGLNQYPDDCGNGELIGTFLKPNRDYFVNVAMPLWKPFTYPHPLRSLALAPTGSGALPLPEK